jgi:hypothetical protein
MATTTETIGVLRAAVDAIGKTAALTVGDLVVAVEILDTKSRFGHIDFLVTPVCGSGQRWAQSDFVVIG